jgi:hypothetical protein
MSATLTINADSADCDSIQVAIGSSPWLAETFTSFPATFDFTQYDVLVIVAYAKAGAAFLRWDVTDSVDYNGSFTANPFTGPFTQSATITAVFEPAASTARTLTIGANNSECDHITYLDNTNSSGSSLTSFPSDVAFTAGDSFTLTAAAKAGFHFVRWSTGVADNPYTKVLYDTQTITAIFAADSSSSPKLTIYADPSKCFQIDVVNNTTAVSNTYLSFPVTIYFTAGDSIKVTAFPKPGAMLNHWLTDDGVSIPNNPYTATWLETGTLNAVIDFSEPTTPSAIVVSLGLHIFNVAPQPTKNCSISAAIIEITDGYDHVHVTGYKNPEITLSIEEVSAAQMADLVTTYENESEITLNIPNFEEAAACRIEKLDYKEIAGVETGRYYQANLTLVVSNIPLITPVKTPPMTSVALGGNIDVNASFGTSVQFPINPQSVSKTFNRNLIRRNLLGKAQKTSSTHVSLTRLEVDGVLTGLYALQTMYNMEAALYAGEAQLLKTPNEPSGVYALLTDLSFNPEKVYFFERQIPFTASFIVIPATSAADVSTYVKHPTFDVQIQNETGTYDVITDVVDVEVDRQYGGQAASFRITLDNSQGQYPYPSAIDYMRNVKIKLGFKEAPGTVQSRLWGVIDDFNYTVSKGQGGTLQLVGRDYLAYMMEGWLLDDYSYITCTFEEIVFGTGRAVGHGLLDTTPISTDRISSPRYDKYWAGNHWPSSQTANNTQRAEMLQKLCKLYRMNFYMDAGEVIADKPPCLVLDDQPRLSMLTADAAAGDTTLYIDYPLLFQQWIGEYIIIARAANPDTEDPGGSEVITFTAITGNQVTITPALTQSYAMADCAFVASYNQGSDSLSSTNPLLHPPVVKLWGRDIISISPGRITGTPLRNRIEVYGDGVYSIADASSPILIPSGNPNPGYISGTTDGSVPTINYIYNPGFELGVWLAQDTVFPYGLTAFSPWYQSTVAKRFGNFSGQAVAPDINSVFSPSNRVNLAAITSSTFTVGVYIKTADLGNRPMVGTFYAELWYYDSYGGLIQTGVHDPDHPLAGATFVPVATVLASFSSRTDWTHVIATINKSSVPTGAAAVAIAFRWYRSATVGATGVAYVDGVQLVSGSTLPAFDAVVVVGDPGLQIKYGKRRQITEDSSLKSITGSGGINCDVYAYTDLIKLEYPTREIHLLCEGDPIVFPGALIRFTDGAYTGLPNGPQSGLIVTGTTERLTVEGGYVVEITTSRLVQTISPALFSNVLKTQAKSMAGGSTLNNQKTAHPMLGRVI